MDQPPRSPDLPSTARPHGVPRSLAVLLAATTACSGAAREGGASGPADRGGEAVAVTGECPPTPAAGRDAVEVVPDLAYATAGGETLRLDLARPRAPGRYPLVVLAHGGGWEGGHRRDMQDDMLELAARGYVAATVSYRLTRGARNRFPAAVQDVRCAVRWLRTRATSLDLDGGRIGALGFSAGAHLASMLGAAAEVPALDRGAAACLAATDAPDASDASPAVQAVVSVAGPQDLRVRGPYTPEQARLVTNFLGAFPGDAPGLAELASPIAHVGAQAAPFLLVHGTRDELVPVEHARRMRDALRGAGVPATVLELRGAGHEFPALDAPDRPEVGCTTLAFLERWLRGR
jgi:acetyl esterase/lipase